MKIDDAMNLLAKLSGPDTERIATDADHDGRDYSRWYRNVKKARAMTAEYAARRPRRRRP